MAGMDLKQLYLLKRQENAAFSMERALLGQYREAQKQVQKTLRDLFERDDGSVAPLKSAMTQAEAEAIYGKGNIIMQDGRPWLVSEKGKRLITRQSTLHDRLSTIIEQLQKQQKTGLQATLRKSYMDSYYRTVFNMQRQAGFAFDFVQLDEKAVQRAILTPWYRGKNFSSRIWADKRKLAASLERRITQGIISGQDMDVMSGLVAHDMDVNYSAAQRLVRTEVNHVYNDAAAGSYAEAGCERYRFVATLDSKTSDICRKLDGQIFRLEDRQPGVNCPPMHPWCRSTTIPIFEDDGPSVPQTRAARDPKTGKTIQVPAGMTYSQWEKSIRPKVEQTPAKKTEAPKKTEREELLERIKAMTPTSYEDLVKQQKPASMTPEQTQAMSRYIGSDYVDINAYLRGDMRPQDAQALGVKALADRMQEVTQKDVLKQDTMLYRGTGIRSIIHDGVFGDPSELLTEYDPRWALARNRVVADKFAARLDEMVEEDAVIEMSGILSTSTSEKHSKYFIEGREQGTACMFRILAPKGSHCAIAGSLNDIEEEVMLSHRSRFRLVGYERAVKETEDSEGNPWIIYLQLLI